MPGRRDSDQVALGRAVRELRARRGVSQHVLSFDAGLYDKYLTRLECGRASPSFATLLRIVRTLRVPLAELAEIYDRHLAEIDPTAGADAAACPTDEALAYARARNARDRQRKITAKARGRMRSWT